MHLHQSWSQQTRGPTCWLPQQLGWRGTECCPTVISESAASKEILCSVECLYLLAVKLSKGHDCDVWESNPNVRFQVQVEEVVLVVCWLLTLM